MTEVHLNFDVSSYWHIGSGRGRDAVLDAEVVRDRQGLPYIPGKTVKGLVRHALELAATARGEDLAPVRALFGSEVPGVRTAKNGDEQVQAVEAGRYDTEPGALWFGSAALPEEWTRWLSARAPDADTDADAYRQDVVDALYRVVASTAIDHRGVAREHTLRVSEVVVPMKLTATVQGPDPAAGIDWVSLLASSLPYLRALGLRRRRGYGRVTVTLERP